MQVDGKLLCWSCTQTYRRALVKLRQKQQPSVSQQPLNSITPSSEETTPGSKDVMRRDVASSNKESMKQRESVEDGDQKYRQSDKILKDQMKSLPASGQPSQLQKHKLDPEESNRYICSCLLQF